MDQLPLVILLQIAESSFDTWKSFVFAHPRIGRWSLQPEYQKYIQRKYTQCTEYQQIRYGIVREYKLCGKRHNVDGPAFELTDGTKIWYTGGEHGLLHSYDDLPAVDYLTGAKHWYQNGLRHRDGDLPASEDADGSKEWWTGGEDNKRHRDSDLPAVENSDGTKEWWTGGENGLRHRDGDLPAIEFEDGTKYWYKNDLRHRDSDLPPIERSDGSKDWY